MTSQVSTNITMKLLTLDFWLTQQSATEAFDANSKPSIDESHVGVAINVEISGIQQVIRCIEGATSEVRDLILNECELVYERRACRNLFRSLANFMHQKRQFCENHFCEIMVLFSSEDMPEEVMIVQPEGPTNDNAEDGQFTEVKKLNQTKTTKFPVD